MTDTISRDQSASWWNLWSNAALLAMGIMASGIAYGAINVYSQYQWEQRVAKELTGPNSSVSSRYFGPRWLPQFIKDRLWVFQRIYAVRMTWPEANPDFERLGSLGHLEYLSVGGANLSENDLRHLQHLPKLISLDLVLSEIPDAGLKRVRSLQTLKSLSLTHTAITNDDLKNFADLNNLQTLILNRTSITDDGLKHLHGLANLKRLSLDGTPTTEAGRKALRQALPNCVIDPPS